MRRIAEEIDSLIYPLQELQDRISLEVPAAFIQEESIRESTDQHIAYYSLLYYLKEDNKPDGKTFNVKKVVDRLAKEVLSEKDVMYQITHDEQGRNTREFVVKVTYPEDRPKTASLRFASKWSPLPFTTYVGEDVYNLATDGASFAVLKNGNVVAENLPSPAYALGAAMDPLQKALFDIEELEGYSSPPNDFIAGSAQSILENNDVPEGAKEHFVKFYELVTLKDFAASEEPEDE